MENVIPVAIDPLFSLAEEAVGGLSALEAAIGITQNTQIVVQADLTSGRTAQSAYEAAINSRLEAVTAQTGAVTDAVDFIHAARDVLKPHLGRQYSQAWNQAGFKNHSLAVPGTIAKRQELLESLATFFTAHTAYEAPSVHVTHQQAADLHGALGDDIDAVNSAWVAQKTARATRDAALAALRTRLRKLIRELANHISYLDPRWEAFGFNVPGDNRLPDAPHELVVAPGAPGHLQVTWPRAPRALRYHVFKQVVGVDADYVLARSVTDPSADLNTFTSGAQVLVEVTALNDAGESVPSEAVEQTVP